MIRARGIDKRTGRGHIVFGLSDRNLELLKQKKPIFFHGETFGVGNTDFTLFWGSTEADMKAELEKMAKLPEENSYKRGEHDPDDGQGPKPAEWKMDGLGDHPADVRQAVATLLDYSLAMDGMVMVSTERQGGSMVGFLIGGASTDRGLVARLRGEVMRMIADALREGGLQPPPGGGPVQ